MQFIEVPYALSAQDYAIVVLCVSQNGTQREKREYAYALAMDLPELLLTSVATGSNRRDGFGGINKGIIKRLR